MRRRILSGLLVAGISVCISGSTPQAQSKGKPGPSNVSVTSQLQDTGAVSPFLLQSDGLGSYVSGDGVVTQVYGLSGDWELDLRDQSLRTIDLTFIPVDGSVGAPPSGRYNARPISRCFAADGTTAGGYLAIGEGSANSRCAMRVENIESGGVSYFLVMSPMYAGTSWVTVSCPPDADTDNVCQRWTVRPDPAVTTPVAALYKIVRNKEVFVGRYALTFALDVTAP